MFGLSVLGIADSFRWLMNVVSTRASGEAKQHSEKGEQADENENDRNPSPKITGLAASRRRWASG
jgi:hypothetical protein